MAGCEDLPENNPSRGVRPRCQLNGYPFQASRLRRERAPLETIRETPLLNLQNRSAQVRSQGILPWRLIFLKKARTGTDQSHCGLDLPNGREESNKPPLTRS